MKAEADHAKCFVEDMLDGGVFRAGLAPDGTKNQMLAADAGIWPFLAGLGPSESALAAIKGLSQSGGIGFSEASAGVWLEGTAFAALALEGNPMKAAFIAKIERNIAPQGYIFATVDPALSTGLTVGPSLISGQREQPFNYYRRPSLSATAWAGLQSYGFNPLEHNVSL